MPHVLCISNDRVNELLPDQGFTYAASNLWGAFQKARHFVWCDKETEDTPERPTNFRQVIPYGIVRHWETTDFVAYLRSKTGDQRLKQKTSFGFGGHTEDRDKHYEASPIETVLVNCLTRELREEIGLDLKTSCIVEPFGFLKDDANDVGRVHIGVIFKIVAPEAAWIAGHVRDPEIQEVYRIGNAKLMNAEYEDFRSKLEPWSKTLLPIIANASPSPAS